MQTGEDTLNMFHLSHVALLANPCVTADCGCILKYDLARNNHSCSLISLVYSAAMTAV